jgi:DNA-binding transcriptional regulator YiaG
MKSELELCPACDVGHLRLVAKSGRRMPLKQIPDLEIPSDFAIPTCDRCDAEIIGDKELATLDTVMKATYADALSKKSEQAIRDLNEAIHQRELERLIGVSAGYVSKLKHSQAEPSGPITALLMLLAAEPRLIDRLRELWTTKRSNVEVLRVSEQGFPFEVFARSEFAPAVAHLEASQLTWASETLNLGRFTSNVSGRKTTLAQVTSEPMALVG